MSLAAKVWVLVTGVLFLAALAIKLYFLPTAEKFSRLTVEEQMHRDMVAFEQIIGVVVTAAQGDKEYVRRALYAISADKTIPIELRRSEFLHRQFGRLKDKEPRNKFEALALTTGNPQFRTTENFIEYAYPLKAQGICMGCHVDNLGKPIGLGEPVGLAVRRVPLRSVTESRIAYFTLDLFWQNFALVSASVLLVLLPIWLFIFRPVRALAAESEQILKAADDSAEIDPVTEFEMSSHRKEADELRTLQRFMRYAKRRFETK
jgi:hypothetical protein